MKLQYLNTGEPAVYLGDNVFAIYLGGCVELRENHAYDPSACIRLELASVAVLVKFLKKAEKDDNS